jgi:hypothetical protein
VPEELELDELQPDINNIDAATAGNHLLIFIPFPPFPTKIRKRFRYFYYGNLF